MDRWFGYEMRLSQDGLYHIHSLHSLSGLPADQMPDFVDQLAHHIVGHATRSNSTLEGVFRTRYQVDITPDEMTRASIARLLVMDRGIHRALMGFAGECLAHWTAVSFVSPLAISLPKPFSKDPAFDLIAVMDVALELRATCTQAKASGGHASHECRKAVDGCCALHAGKYEMELANELYFLAAQPDVRERLKGQEWRDVLMNRDRREYEIFATFSGSPPYSALNTWADRLPGTATHRGLVELPVSDFPTFMARLAEAVRGKVG